ncbi:JHE-like carboxylesterase 1 [Penaeus vannamei]|uniref:JHE-like carboxylesterase 1 n=1 Tax=Penaeus vannamei TaxID=6689 RepID=A0A3R7PH25_PENVA|nr:JHE-like carboxylesterase 1 [Penaeus vannamei]
MRFLVSAVLLCERSRCSGGGNGLGAAPAGRHRRQQVRGQGREVLLQLPGHSYAEPPVGSLRFKDPLPAGAWEGVRNGSVAPPACPQPFYPLKTSEDCLFLNVFTPRSYKLDYRTMGWFLPMEYLVFITTSFTGLQVGPPVMVWFLPGAFVVGSMEIYRPEYLVAKDVVYVTVQSRLGILGYLSTEDSELPGNLGLKDQTLALKWVQDNIHALGGDPDKVTIFGQNAGGASVHYHILSPMSKGLFKRAIMQSGTALCSWSVREDHRYMAGQIGSILDCPGATENPNSSDLVDCLKKVPADQLTAALLKMPTPYVMGPRVDGEFLPDHPATLVREGRYNRVDIIAGKTRDEGALQSFLKDGVVDAMIKSFGTIGPYMMGLNVWDDNIDFIGRLIFHRYMGPIEFDMSKVHTLVKLIGDCYFNMCTMDAIENHARDTAFGNESTPTSCSIVDNIPSLTLHGTYT